jgi:hypothetical protein
VTENPGVKRKISVVYIDLASGRDAGILKEDQHFKIYVRLLVEEIIHVDKLNNCTH